MTGQEGNEIGSDQQQSSLAQRRKLILETSIDGFCMIGLDSRFLDVNSSLCDITGYSKEELLNMKIKDIDASMSQEDIARRIDQVVKQGYGRFETKHRCKDGKIIDVEVSTQYCDFGKEKFFFAFFRDITDIKFSMCKLQKSERTYKTLCSNMPGMIYKAISDWSTEIVSNSRAVCGYDPEEINSKKVNWLDIIHPDDRERVRREAFSLEKKASRITQEYRIIAKDGSIHWVEDNKTSIFAEDGSYAGVDGVVFDITERKQAQDGLKESEARFRKLSEAAFEGIAIHENRKVIDVNQRFVEMFGYTLDELENIDGIALAAPDCRETVRELIKAGHKGPYETIGLKKDGSMFPVEIRASEMRSQGHIFRVVTVRDLSAQKQLEAERENYKEKLSKAQRRAYIGSMGAIVAHQLNQPLTYINILLDRAIEKAEDGSCCPEVIKDVKEALAKAGQAASMIRKFRHCSKDSALENQGRVSLSVVAGKILSVLSERSQQAGICVCIKGLDNLPEVRTNETALEQIFLILIQNAIEAADSEKNNKLEIIGKFIDDHIELQFADDCRGISAENIGKIFEPFFTTKTEDKGMGLGLDIVKQILISCGGNIRVESEPGKGTKFYVILPVNTI